MMSIRALTKSDSCIKTTNTKWRGIELQKIARIELKFDRKLTLHIRKPHVLIDKYYLLTNFRKETELY